MSKLHFSKINSFDDDENNDLQSFQPLKKKVSNNKPSDKSDKNKSDNDGFNEINGKNKKKFSK